MTLRRILTTATATAVAGAAAFVPAGQAADTASTPKVSGAYAYPR